MAERASLPADTPSVRQIMTNVELMPDDLLEHDLIKSLLCLSPAGRRELLAEARASLAEQEQPGSE